MGSLLLLLGWVFICVVISLFGRDRKIGFWVPFIVSLFLTPLVGLILIFTSPLKGGTASFVKTLDLAKKAEHRGDNEGAIRYLKDTLYEIENAPKAANKHQRNFREKTKNEIQQKLKNL